MVEGFGNELPPTMAARIDEACDRFEAAWKAGSRPRLEDYLGEFLAAGQPQLLRELLILELAYRRRDGQRPQPHEYQDRFPTHTALIQAVFDLPTNQVPGPDASH